MSWVMVGVAGAGATTSYLNNQAAKKREQDNMMANAAAIQYSPWSGMHPQFMSKSAGTSDLGAIISGGVGGAMFGSQFGKGKPAPGGDADIASGGGDAATGDNMLGGQNMNKQLAAQGSNFKSSMPAPQAMPAVNAPMPPPDASQMPGQPSMAYGAQPGSPWSVMPQQNKKLSFYQ